MSEKKRKLSTTTTIKKKQKLNDILSSELKKELGIDEEE